MMWLKVQLVLLVEVSIYNCASHFPSWIPRFHERFHSAGKKPASIHFPPNQSGGAVVTRDAVSPDSEPCECVPLYQCDAETNTIITDGTGMVNYKFGLSSCGNDEVCCKIPDDDDDDDDDDDPIKEVDGPGRSNSNVSTPVTENPPEGSGDPETSNFPDDYRHYQDCGRRTNLHELKISTKIAGDFDETETQEGDHPWALVLHFVDETPTGRIKYLGCGATLISPEIALTAAHCVARKNKEKLSLSAGEFDINRSGEVNEIQERNIKQIVVHPKYSSVPIRYDVALLLVDEAFKKNDAVNTVCLATRNEMERNTWKDCVGVGWGTGAKEVQVVGPNPLKKASMSIIPHKSCEQQLQKTKLGKLYSLHKSFMCAAGKVGVDTCKGDGGGPLTCSDEDGRNYILGVTSWGLAGGCGKGIPGMYSDVVEMYDWISSTMNSLSQ